MSPIILLFLQYFRTLGPLSKDKAPINKLIVKPISQSREAPYICNHVTPNGNSHTLYFIKSQMVPKTPICFPKHCPNIIPSDNGLDICSIETSFKKHLNLQTQIKIILQRLPMGVKFFLLLIRDFLF